MFCFKGPYIYFYRRIGENFCRKGESRVKWTRHQFFINNMLEVLHSVKTFSNPLIQK